MLVKFHTVVGRRVYLPLEEEDEEALRTSWWAAFDAYLAAAKCPVRFDSADPGYWREVELGPGVSLWGTYLAEECWIGAGLEFSGKRGVVLFGRGKSQLGSLSGMIGTAV